MFVHGGRTAFLLEVTLEEECEGEGTNRDSEVQLGKAHVKAQN